MRGSSIDGPLQRLNSTCSATDDEHLLVLCLLTVELGRVEDVSIEFLLVRQVRYFRVTTCSYRNDYAIESAVAWVVDDPAALLVL